MQNRAMNVKKLAIRLLSVALFGTTLIWGQFTSQIEGSVLDPTRGSIPGATITLLNVDSGVTLTARTNTAGDFRFPTLPAATFKVTVTAAGFETEQVTDIRLEVGETRTVNVTMKLGAASTSVTVGAEAAAVELSDARVSGVIENAQIQALPISGQNFLYLAILTPGVIGTGAPANVFSGQVQPALNAAGTRQEQNGFSVDGSTVTSMVRHGNTNLQPNEDSIEDVRITVNNFSAEQGSDAGASINVLTKSGTNNYHGSMFWYHEDNILTSRTIFQNTVNAVTGRVFPVSRRNEAGGSIGGPVIKNKMFLFGAFDILRQSNADGTVYTVQTPQFAQFVEQNFPNNKSAYLYKNFVPLVVPTTAFKTAGSVLPSTAVNCANLSNPASPVTIAGSNVTIPCNMNILGNGVSPQAITQAPFQWNVRWDYNIREKDRLYVQFYRDVAATYTGSTVYPAFSYISPFHNYLASITETHTFTPSLINEFKVSAVRTLGNVFCGSACNIPTIGISGAGAETGFGAGGPTPFSQNNFEYRDNVTWLHGAHTVKAGIQIQRLDANWNPGPGYERPGYSFTSLASFLEDTPFSESNIGFNPTNGTVYAPAAAERFFTLQAFGQDTWKITPNFTLTLGLRYEYYGRVAQATGGQNVEWGTGTNLWTRIEDGSDVSKHYVFDHAPMLNLAPRVSFAWDPFKDGKTSVRFGFGKFYDALASQVWGGQHYTPPLYEIVTEATNLAAPLNQPLYSFGANSTDPYDFPRPAGLNGAIGLDAHNGSTLAPANIVWDDEQLKNPYTLSYFLGVQRSVSRSTTLEVNFVGNQGRHLYAQWDLNRYDDSILQNNGVVGHLNNSFGTINYSCACFNSSVASGNAVVRQRFSHGLFLQGTYTFEHVLDQADTFGGGLGIVDAWNTKNEYGNAGYDVAQKLAFSAIYQIPTPHFSSSFVSGAISGWQLSTVTVLQTGGRYSITCSTPFTAVRNSAGVIVGNSGCDYNADGNTSDRPNAPSFTPSQLNMSVNNLINVGAFTASQFPAPCLGCDGNLGRDTYTNPGYADVDMSMSKTFTTPWVTGDKKGHLLVRVDAFNALNRVNLGGINAGMASVNFGKVTSAGAARTFQIAAKFRF